MSKSNDHGCKPKCGLCHPEKRYKHQISRVSRMKVSDQRRAGKERKHGGY